MKEKKMKKILKNLPSGMKDELYAFAIEKLKERVLESETILTKNKEDMENDEDLSNAKELVKDLSADYKDVEKSQRAIIEYSLYLLSEKGAL